MVRQRSRYRIIYSTCSLPKEDEKKLGEKLFVFFSCGGNRRKAYFQDEIVVALRNLGAIKRMSPRVIKAIEATVPKNTVTFRVKLTSKNDPCSIHPDHLMKWAKRVKEKLEEE